MSSSPSPSHSVRVPDDVFLEILSYLKPSELVLCNRVSPDWNRLANRNSLWKEFGREKFGEYLKVDSAKDFLREYHSQHLSSNDEVVARIQKFADRVSIGHNGRFRFVFGSPTKHRVITIVIKGDREKFDRLRYEGEIAYNVREFDIKDTAYALHRVGRGDLINPDPPREKWGCDVMQTLNLISKHHKSVFTRGNLSAVVEYPVPLASETDRNTELHFSQLQHQTQMQQKIINILETKVISLSNQNDRETNKRILLIVATAIFLFSFMLKVSNRSD